MSGTEIDDGFHEHPIIDFDKDVLRDYIGNLDTFFDPETGAVREPSRDDGSPGFLYTEVTGYAIDDFIRLNSITGDGQYLERANKSADWIINKAMDPCGGVKTRYYFEHDGDPDLADKSFKGRRVYAFDTGICLKGLTTLHKATDNESLVEPARKMGDFLVDKMIDQSGDVSPIYNAGEARLVREIPEVWSKRSGSFLAKTGEGLTDLAKITGEGKYQESAVLICQTALESQMHGGNFETSVMRTEMHPHFYTAEGLLYVGTETSNQKFIKAAREATEWALSKSQNGEIAQVFDTSTGNPLAKFRTDALAQTLAVAADLRSMGQLDSKYFGEMDELAAKILEMKSKKGYFEYGHYDKKHKGTDRSNTLSYWTQMFCLRGLRKYYEVARNSYS